MVHFALICPPFYSHVRVFEALAEELVARGHRATFVLNGGAGALVEVRSLGIETAGADTGLRLGETVRRAARPNGPLGVLRTVADTARLTDELCEHGPAILKRIGAEAIVGDQMEPAAGLLAAHLGIPHVSIACALPVNSDPAIPLPFLGWPYDPSERGLKRNRGGEAVARLLLSRQRATIRHWSERFGIGRRETLEDCLSPILQIAQTVEGFDYPRGGATPLRFVGPIRGRGSGERSLDFGIDPERPFVFASFGTLQGHRTRLFRTIAAACRELGAQLLVAHCGRLNDSEAGTIGATWTTDFAPQRAVLARADICITHAGLNTALDALQAGVPMLAIPIAFDQPGVAAQIVGHGVGERLSRILLSPARVRACLERLLRQPSYRQRARAIGREIEASGGGPLAATLIEQATVPGLRSVEGRTG